MCMCGSRAQKGKERMEGVGETEGGGVSRPQKSIGWEERAEIICAVRGQRGRANRGWGRQSETQREAWSTKTVRDRTDNRLTVEKVRKMNQELQKKKIQRGEDSTRYSCLTHSVSCTKP